MVSASLALDYALGRGYNVFWFHLSTFAIYLLQLVAMYAFFSALLGRLRPETAGPPSSSFAALFAVAWYGLHPAMAETVNYIIQRGDVCAATGVVTALALWVRLPAWRKTGLYLLPLALALLSKPPAVVFPVLFFLYIVLFEQEGPHRFRRAALDILPSLAVCAALLILEARMTPKSFLPSTLSEYSFCITQPFVLLRYFGAFFLPLHLNVDTDLSPFAALTGAALAGFLFVAALLALAAVTLRKQILRPIAYGLLWFLIASLPTSLYRLSEVENDHRMYLPFVGLALAVVWAAWLGVERLAALAYRVLVWRAAAIAALLVLAACAYGTHRRNQVWRTEASLWLDDVEKCPRNGRGLMNYGLTQMAIGQYAVALDYFNRAAVFTPNYKTLEINLGIVHGALNQAPEAVAHFERAIAIDSSDDASHYFYGRWLYQSGKIPAAIEQLQTAVALNPSHLPARELLAQAYVAAGNQAAARSVAAETLRYDPSDSNAKKLLAGPVNRDADYWIDASLYQYRSGDFRGCIDSARQALKLNPNSALAYNNIGAAYAALKQYDVAIENERRALRVEPDLQVAKNNLALYTSQRSAAARHPAANATPEDWLNASLRDYQGGRYEQSIRDAEEALQMRPAYAEAYNNIAAGYAALGKWDQAIAAAQAALRIKPDFPLARNNLAWAQSKKTKAPAGR